MYVSPLHVQHCVKNIRQESSSPETISLCFGPTSHIIIHQNSPLGHLHLADVHVALLGDDPLAELLVMRLEVEEVFARQLLPDHVPQPPGGPGPGAPGDGVLTGELTLRLTLQGPGHLDVLDATLAVIHRDQGRTLAEVVLVPDLEVGVEHFLRG